MQIKEYFLYVYHGKAFLKDKEECQVLLLVTVWSGSSQHRASLFLVFYLKG